MRFNRQGHNIIHRGLANKTFKENSILKAQNIPSSHICISDDSGLCINALDGFPGIYSARFAKKSGGWNKAMQELYKNNNVVDARGGGPIFGVNGVSIIGHGSATAGTVQRAVGTARMCIETKLIEKMLAQVKRVRATTT